MINFTYDIPKRKIVIKSDNKDVGDNTKQIIIAISICATTLICFNIYIEHQKCLMNNK